MENQLLELRLKAHFDAKIFLGGDLPAEVENAFLKNILKFENNFSQAEDTTIRDLLGNPPFKAATELSDGQIQLLLGEVTDMMLSKNIMVDYIGDYDNLTKYKFITEELFHESFLCADIPDMMIHFIYEEFHPNHQIDLEKKAKKFLSALFEKDTDKFLWELADRIVLPEGRILNRDQVKEKLQNMFECYMSFSECTYSITDINYEVIDDAGMAYAEGTLSYNAIMAYQEAIAIQGPFKLYFCLEYGWWDIWYFVVPGLRLAEISY